MSCNFTSGAPITAGLFHSRGPTHDHGHGHSHEHGGEHGHTHEVLDHPGKFTERNVPDWRSRDFGERAFTVGIGGPVGSGKTALLLALCEALRGRESLGVVTNDIFTREDAEFLVKHAALQEEGRITAVETGGCPHAAIREDVSANLAALERLQAQYDTGLLFVESGGDNLAAAFSVELADFHIYAHEVVKRVSARFTDSGHGTVIDVAGGDKVPRKGGPGISQADVLVINKIDLAPLVGADLSVMARDASLMRDRAPTVFTAVKSREGVQAVVDLVLAARQTAYAQKAAQGGI